MTRIDEEIASQLYDPKKVSWRDFVKSHSHMRTGKGLLDLKAISKLWKMKSKAYDPKILGDTPQKRTEREWKAKAQVGKRTRGQMTLTGGASGSKRLSEFFYDIKGIKQWLRQQGVEPDLIDVEAEYDHRLSHSENLKRFRDMLGRGIRKSYGTYSKMTKSFYSGMGKLINASPAERAAAFARMRETGTLRGYDPAPKSKHGDFYRPYSVKTGKWLSKVWYSSFKDAQDAAKMFGHSLANVKIAKSEGSFYNGKLIRKSSVATYDPAPKHGINRPPKNWFYAMLQGIKKSSDVRNPGAIVGSIWRRLSPSKKAEIKSREAKGERFKYDLPLPDDRPTRGTGTLRMVKPFKLAEVQVNISAKDYIAAIKSGLFSKMRRNDGTIALVARCKSDKKNCNIFVDKVR